VVLHGNKSSSWHINDVVDSFNTVHSYTFSNIDNRRTHHFSSSRPRKGPRTWSSIRPRRKPDRGSTSVLLSRACRSFVFRIQDALKTRRRTSPYVIIILFARDSIYAKRAYAIAIPSVCLSHGWISQKRLKLGSCNFHHTVAPSL